MVVGCVCAKPKPDVLVGAPLVATPLATSNIAYSEFSAPLVAYPYAYSAPYVAAAPYAAYTSTVLL